MCGTENAFFAGGFDESTVFGNGDKIFFVCQTGNFVNIGCLFTAYAFDFNSISAVNGD